MSKRIGILVVAYNAATTLAQVLDRIPEDFRPRIAKILVGDDASDDATYLVGLGYQQAFPDMPLEVVRNARNLGYGGNQKAGYRWAIDHDLDIVVLLHGDGQYAPEFLPKIVEPLEEGRADAVFGSRMLEQGAARQGGMPLYKWVGNRILTRIENTVAGTQLSEWHSGYRAYSVAALQDLPFARNDDGFNFDTQVIVQLLEAGKRIVELPIPTYYGDEICYVNGLRYARDVITDVGRYRLHKMGLGTGELAFASESYPWKTGLDSSHQRLLGWLAKRSASRILDLGCGDGRLGEELRRLGHHVVGVDLNEQPGVADRLDRFVQADLDRGLPDEAKDRYDVVLAADVFEHVRAPEQLLTGLHDWLAPGGAVVASVPNFGHWYPRVRTALGRFDYDRRGILDADHVRFFTLRSFNKLVERTGWEITRQEGTGTPLETLDRGGRPAPDAAEAPADRSPAHDGADGGAPPGLAAKLDRAAVNLRPQLFAYQFLIELRPT